MVPSREAIEQVLALQGQAYALLMWLADEATRDPDILAPEAVAALREPERALTYLERHSHRIPSHLLPADLSGAFVNLLSSFFSASFGVKHLEFEGRLVESRVTVGGEPDPKRGAGIEQCQAVALRQLASAEKMTLTDKEARYLVRRKRLEGPSLLWTYVWELERRAKDKGQGSVAHRIWRELPRETRKTLDIEQVWRAREELLSAVRDFRSTGAP